MEAKTKHISDFVTTCSPSVGDDDNVCPICGHVPDTHRKRQVRHLHVKSEGMVKFIWELQQVLGVTVGFKRMIAEVRNLKDNTNVDVDAHAHE